MNIDTLKSLLWWAAIGIFFFWMMRRGGCGSMAHGHGHGGTRSGGDKGPDRPMSGNPRDPVCRMEVEPAVAIGTRVVAGRTFFLCSQTCIDTFDKNPDLYTRGGTAEAAARHQHAGC